MSSRTRVPHVTIHVVPVITHVAPVEPGRAMVVILMVAGIDGLPKSLTAAFCLVSLRSRETNVLCFTLQGKYIIFQVMNDFSSSAAKKSW